jgi:transglutaminase-like putative cysteine protease
MNQAPWRQTRSWVVTSAGLAQVAAARAGMLPWWALPLTVVLTMAVARQTGPVDDHRTRLARGVGVTIVGTFALIIALRAVALGPTLADPQSTMRSLTEALVVLSLVMAPTWRTARDYRVWLSVTTGVLVAAAVGSHSVTTDVLLAAAWVLVLLALASIQRIALLESVTGQVASGSSPAPTPGRLSPAMPVFASLAAGALVFLALPAGLGGGGIAPRLLHGNSQAGQGVATSRSTVGVDTSGAGTLSLLVRGALPSTPLLRVSVDSPMLWRGSIYPTYTGNSWQAEPAQGFAYSAGNDVAVPRSAIDPRPVGPTKTYHAYYEPGLHSSLLWAPGVPLRLRGDGGEIRGIVRSPANVRIIGAQEISGYTVKTSIATTSPARLIAAKGRDLVNTVWTTLPTELPARVSQLAHVITADATSRYEQVNELEAYLRRHETYSLNSPIPGPGQDAVADFLFRDHTGFCEQFASAEAVMLRTLDVPARVVTGLAYGTRHGDTRLLTAADAHAWVEVYYPGIGWSPTDPTAGVSLANPTAGSRSQLSAVLHRISTDLPGGRIGLIAVLFAILLGTATIGRTVSSWAARRRDRPTGWPPGPVLAAFNRFANRRPPPIARAPAETAREYVERVRPPGSLEFAVSTLEQECYGQDRPDAAEVKEAVAAFQAERLT